MALTRRESTRRAHTTRRSGRAACDSAAGRTRLLIGVLGEQAHRHRQIRRHMRRQLPVTALGAHPVHRDRVVDHVPADRGDPAPPGSPDPDEPPRHRPRPASQQGPDRSNSRHAATTTQRPTRPQDQLRLHGIVAIAALPSGRTAEADAYAVQGVHLAPIHVQRRQPVDTARDDRIVACFVTRAVSGRHEHLRPRRVREGRRSAR
jgi:hypothetical protein